MRCALRGSLDFYRETTKIVLFIARRPNVGPGAHLCRSSNENPPHAKCPFLFENRGVHCRDGDPSYGLVTPLFKRSGAGGRQCPSALLPQLGLSSCTSADPVVLAALESLPQHGRAFP